MSRKMSKREEKVKKAEERTMQKAADKPCEAIMELVVRGLAETQLRVAQVKICTSIHWFLGLQNGLAR